MIEHLTRNVIIGGKRTSIRLERAFRPALEEIVEREYITLNTLVTRISFVRIGNNNLSGAVLIFIFSYFHSPAHQIVLLISLGYESRAYN